MSTSSCHAPAYLSETRVARRRRTRRSELVRRHRRDRERHQQPQQPLPRPRRGDLVLLVGRGRPRAPAAARLRRRLRAPAPARARAAPRSAPAAGRRWRGCRNDMYDARGSSRQESPASSLDPQLDPGDHVVALDDRRRAARAPRPPPVRARAAGWPPAPSRRRTARRCRPGAGPLRKSSRRSRSWPRANRTSHPNAPSLYRPRFFIVSAARSTASRRDEAPARAARAQVSAKSACVVRHLVERAATARRRRPGAAWCRAARRRTRTRRCRRASGSPPRSR